MPDEIVEKYQGVTWMQLNVFKKKDKVHVELRMGSADKDAKFDVDNVIISESWGQVLTTVGSNGRLETHYISRKVPREWFGHTLWLINTNGSLSLMDEGHFQRNLQSFDFPRRTGVRNRLRRR